MRAAYASYLTRVSLPLLAGAFLFACAQNKFDKGGSASKPSVTKPLETQDDAKAANVDIANTKYDMTIYTGYGTASQNALCKGEVSMLIRSQFGGLAPQGVIDCTLIGQLDLGKMMPAEEELEELTPAMLKSYKGYGQIARLPNPRSRKYTFQPPLPIIIGPLIQDAGTFADFKFAESSSVIFSDPNASVKSAAGEIRYEVLEHHTNFPMTNRKYTFENVIHYKRTVTGFDGVPDRGQLMLYEEMQFWYNTQPVAIPQIVITASPSQVAGLSIDPIIATIGDLFLGKLTIVMSLKEHTEIER